MLGYITAKRFMPRRPMASSTSAFAWAVAVSMFWKTCGPASVSPSCFERETNGSCSSSGVAPALVRAGERDGDAQHVRAHEGELRDAVEDPLRVRRVGPVGPAQEHLA